MSIHRIHMHHGEGMSMDGGARVSIDHDAGVWYMVMHGCGAW
ncbi:hypothetical protein [Breznakibacter xylanolyticus]|nr:hypothetical protein [Breznakibacter xylanolyticus]